MDFLEVASSSFNGLSEATGCYSSFSSLKQSEVVAVPASLTFLLTEPSTVTFFRRPRDVRAWPIRHERHYTTKESGRKSLIREPARLDTLANNELEGGTELKAGGSVWFRTGSNTEPWVAWSQSLSTLNSVTKVEASPSPVAARHPGQLT
ncbi:hypothetical protein GOBAR_DD03918 [Gossypium barbadense]|nr:hypothetical protein GOBAR_DD03918 [Gossypium barbadense]